MCAACVLLVDPLVNMPMPCKKSRITGRSSSAGARTLKMTSQKLEQQQGPFQRISSSGALVDSFRFVSRVMLLWVLVCLFCRTFEPPSTCQRAVLGRNLQFTDEDEENVFWAPLGVLHTKTSKDKRISRHFKSVQRKLFSSTFACRVREVVDNWALPTSSRP